MTINPSIISIPTTYKGVRFRSRLEAKWAAFFDLLEWQWEYEPYDLEGWTPDFAIKGLRGDILVEVKPLPCAVYSVEYDKATQDVLMDTCDILLLGYAPVINEYGFCIGLSSNIGFRRLSTMAIVAKSVITNKYGYYNGYGCDDIITGFMLPYQAKLEMDFNSRQRAEIVELMRLWGLSGTKVQWRGK